MDMDLLVDEQLTDNFHYMIFPNLTFNFTYGSFLFFRPRPHPTDPNKCYWDYQVYARVPEGAPPPRRPATVYGTARNHPELFEALEQDMAQAQIVQESYHSKGSAASCSTARSAASGRCTTRWTPTSTVRTARRARPVYRTKGGEGRWHIQRTRRRRPPAWSTS